MTSVALLAASFMLGLLFSPEDGGMSLRHVDSLLTDFMALCTNKKFWEELISYFP
jgi:hypothetical protein